MNNYQVKVIRVLEETAYFEINANTFKDVADEIDKLKESESIVYSQSKVKAHKAFVTQTVMPLECQIDLVLEGLK